MGAIHLTGALVPDLVTVVVVGIMVIYSSHSSRQGRRFRDTEGPLTCPVILIDNQRNGRFEALGFIRDCSLEYMTYV